MKYFKIIKKNFDEEEFPIDESELEKALYCQIAKQVGFFKNGSVDGADISSIVADYHRAMGFNQGYKLTAEDWSYINRDCKGYPERITEAQLKVKEIVASGRTELLENKTKELAEFNKNQ